MHRAFRSRIPRQVAALTAGLVAVWLAAARASGEEDTTPIRPGQPVVLFNGRDLTGWSGWLVDSGREDPRAVFSVTNGLLRISGDGLGYLGTRSAYRDYRLVVEYRWGRTNWTWNDRVGRARDSGLFLHATGPDGNSHDGGGAFMAAIECNVFEGATGDFLLIRGDDAAGRLIEPRIRARVAPGRDPDGWFWWDPAGVPAEVRRWGRVNRLGKSASWNDVLGFRAVADLEHPPGEWNRLECDCAGDRITVRLNGVTVNAASDVHPAAGRILLQCEGSEIFYRRVELLPWEDPGRGAAAGPGPGTPGP